MVRYNYSTKEIASHTDYPYWRVKGLAKHRVIYSTRRCANGNFYYPYIAILQVQEIKNWLEETGKSCANYSTLEKMLRKRGLAVSTSIEKHHKELTKYSEKEAREKEVREKETPMIGYGQQSASRDMELVDGIKTQPVALENRVVEVTLTGANYAYCKKNAAKSCIDVSAFLNIRVNSLLDKMSKI